MRCIGRKWMGLPIVVGVLALLLCVGAGAAEPGKDVAQEFTQAKGQLKDVKVDVRVAAAVKLGELGNAEAGPLLIEALADAEGKVRAAAAHSLGQLKHEAAIEALLKLEVDADAEVRAQRAWALGECKAKDAEQSLRIGLKDAVANVRAESVRALGKISRSAHGYFYAPLNDEQDGLVRAAAAEALGLTGDVNAETWLRRKLDDKDPRVRACTLRALGMLHVPVGAIALHFTREDDQAARTAAIDAMLMYQGRYGEIAAIAGLLLPNPNAEIRAQTLTVLKKLTDQDFGENADAWMKWCNDQLAAK